MNLLPRWLTAVSAALLVALATGGTWYYRSQQQEVRRNVEANLTSVAQLKVAEIVQWRAERRGDASVFTQSPSITEAVEQWMARPGTENTARIVAEFQSLMNNYRYRDILLVDAHGQVCLAMTGRTAPLHPAVADAVVRAFRLQRPVFGDLFLEAGSESATGDLVAPLSHRAAAATRPEPFAAIILQIDARDFLYPVTQSWPTPSRSAEILFVRRDGDAVLYLNALRKQPAAAFHLRIPLARQDVPAVMAVLGRQGVVEGVDYNGVPVVAALEAIPESPWFLVAKMDMTEAMAEWRLRALLIVVSLLLVAAGVAGGLGMISQQHRRFRDLSRSADALREREERLRDTLDLNEKLVGAAPIGILAFDADGTSILVNEAAPAIIGATVEQARAQNFRQIEAWKKFGLLAAAERALDTGEDQRTEIHVVTTFNKEIWLDCSLARFESNGRRRLLLMFRDITARKKAEEALRQSLSLLQATLQSTADGILAVNREGKITSDNERYMEIMGVPPELLASADAAPLLRHVMLQMKDPEAFAARVAALEADPSPEAVDVLEFRDGRIVERHSRPQMVDGCPVGRVWSFRDVTKRRQDEAEQKRLTAELSRSNTDLEQFAYVASHDLKAPLRAIDSLSLWLQEDLAPLLTQESAKHLTLLRQRTQRMERLLDDLLAYSRAGRVEADIRTVDVAQLIARIAELLDPPPGFAIEVVPPQPVFATALTPLHQVFANLIGNAVKHHDRKEGIIRVTTRDLGDFYEFTVEDDGPGIPAQYHERIFDMFQTLKPRDQMEGSGIGLALVKRIVLHYGGTVGVLNRGERGSAFHFTWPKTLPHPR
jgi:PAS domain S-box-containing protein